METDEFEGLKTYRVRRAPQAPVLDGSLDEPVWDEAELLQDLLLPWNSEPPQRTEVRLLWDADALYAGFRVWDRDLISQTPDDSEGKMAVVNHDRVEVFFALDPALSRYYCFEIDPLGLVLDYQASYYRQIDFSWSFGLQTAARRTDYGYTIEAAFPLDRMQALGLAHPERAGSWRAGVYRADFRNSPDGAVEQLWQSWIDPAVPKPDFHVPSSFGRFLFER